MTTGADDPSGVLRQMHGEWAGNRFDMTVLNEAAIDSFCEWLGK
jgi:hypothetical protein